VRFEVGDEAGDELMAPERRNSTTMEYDSSFPRTSHFFPSILENTAVIKQTGDQNYQMKAVGV